MLTADDPLPTTPRRVLVAGTSGTGKTTLAVRIGELLDLPHTEIDALFHGPGWVPRPEFVADVEALRMGERWVTEWQYTAARALLAERADLLVWLDLPFRVTLARLVRRTVVRRIRREELWNGNRETPLHTVLTDRDHVIRWAIDTRHKTAERVAALGDEHPALPVVRLRSRAEVDRWTRRIAVPPER